MEKEENAGHQGLYSPTILKNVLSLVLQIFQYLEAFECNTTSDWLRFSQSEVVLISNLQISERKTKECY